MTPYEELKHSPYWHLVSESLNTLVENVDVVINTNPEYAVGFIVKAILASEEFGSEND